MKPTIGNKKSTNSHAHVELALRRSFSKKMIIKASIKLMINPRTNKIAKIVPKYPKFMNVNSYMYFHLNHIKWIFLLYYSLVTKVTIAL